MPRVPRWKESREDGVFTVHLKRWRWFDDFLREFIISNTAYIFRGHACGEWKLESTLDRLLRASGRLGNARARELHLKGFQLAARGRRGHNPAVLATENDWWALGQHHGLATPLLDWTRSPYVAAYFAYSPTPSQGTGRRVVFALQESLVQNYCKGGTTITGIPNPILPPNGKLAEEERIATFVPYSNENARLVSQSGLFTRGPNGEDVESWVRRHFAGIKKGILVKVTAPESDREDALRGLNRMNINHLSLFPDLFGSSRHCNLALTIPSYESPAV